MKGPEDSAAASSALLALPTHLATTPSIDAELARHAVNIRLYVRSLMPGYEGADDIAQETLLKIWQKRQDYIPGSNFKAWAFQIARYLVLNRRRRLANSRVILLDEELMDRVDQVWNEEPTLPIEDELDALALCLQKLRPEDQQMLRARYLSRIPLREQAASLGLRLPTLRARLFRLRSALARSIERELQEQR